MQLLFLVGTARISGMRRGDGMGGWKWRREGGREGKGVT